MKKIVITSLILIVTLLLAGCDKITQYHLSEQQINQSLEKRIKFSKDIGLPGIADAHITLNNLASQIGREEPNKITLIGEAVLNLTSIFGNQQITLKLTIKTQPTFDQNQGAIYLRDLQLVDFKANPDKMSSILKTLLPYLNQSLSTYFEQNPAYILDPNHSKAEALAKKFAKGIEVKPGEIVIPFL